MRESNRITSGIDVINRIPVGLPNMMGKTTTQQITARQRQRPYILKSQQLCTAFQSLLGRLGLQAIFQACFTCRQLISRKLRGEEIGNYSNWMLPAKIKERPIRTLPPLLSGDSSSWKKPVERKVLNGLLLACRHVDLEERLGDNKLAAISTTPSPRKKGT